MTVFRISSLMQLKPGNIFYDIVSTSPLQLHFVLGDFGIARAIGDYKRVRGLDLKVSEGISFRYASPELFRLYDSGLSSSPIVKEDPALLLKSDVWAFGVILWQLAERNSIPWQSCSYSVVQSKTLRGETPAFTVPTSSLSDKYKTLTESMWIFDPKDRASFESIRGRL